MLSRTISLELHRSRAVYVADRCVCWWAHPCTSRLPRSLLTKAKFRMACGGRGIWGRMLSRSFSACVLFADVPYLKLGHYRLAERNNRKLKEQNSLVCRLSLNRLVWASTPRRSGHILMAARCVFVSAYPETTYSSCFHFPCPLSSPWCTCTCSGLSLFMIACKLLPNNGRLRLSKSRRCPSC